MAPSHKKLFNVTAKFRELSSLDGQVIKNHENATYYKNKWNFDPLTGIVQRSGADKNWCIEDTKPRFKKMR